MKEPREFDYFKAWLLFFLVATIGLGLVGIVIGSFLAAFLGAGGMPLPESDSDSPGCGLCDRQSDFLHHFPRCRGEVSVSED